MVVGAIDSDGWPTAALAAPRIVDGVLSLGFSDDDHFLEGLGRDPNVCCVADEHESYYEIRGVIIHGQVVSTGAVGNFRLDPRRTISFDFGRLEH
jgi:hypothetical protein